MSPSLDMNHLYFYNPSFYSSTFSYYYYLFLLYQLYTWIFLGPSNIVILISHPASCSPNTPHFFMDDAVIFYGQFPTCNITHSWPFCPEYFPTPLLTRKVLFILQLQLKFQLRQLVALPSVPSALFWESQTSFFFQESALLIVTSPVLSTIPCA